MAVRSMEEVREAFSRRGITPRRWALANGFKPFVIYNLLNGVTHGRRGDSHRAAVLLGLKEGEVDETPNLKGSLFPANERAPS